jgi:hypothetical protein
MAFMSRPEKLIDWEKVDHLLMAGCKGTEIAPHFDMHVNTFYDKVKEKHNICFTDYSCIKKEQGDSLLKVCQYEKALEKDNTMMIWLGKQRLDQREPEAVRAETTHSEPITVAIAETKDLNAPHRVQPESSEVPRRSDGST